MISEININLIQLYLQIIIVEVIQIIVILYIYIIIRMYTLITNSITHILCVVKIYYTISIWAHNDI